MASQAETLLRRLHSLQGRRDLLLEQSKEARKASREAVAREGDARVAREFFLAVAQQTQASLEKRLSEIVSLALAAVFDEPYAFKINYVTRRGVTECDLVFERDGREIDPLGGAGGGAVDIAAFALRIAVWALGGNRRPVIILDEPFRNLSANLHERAGQMLQMLSRKLGLQIVMVSHNPDIVSGADAVFRVNNGKVAKES